MARIYEIKPPAEKVKPKEEKAEKVKTEKEMLAEEVEKLKLKIEKRELEVKLQKGPEGDGGLRSRLLDLTTVLGSYTVEPGLPGGESKWVPNFDDHDRRLIKEIIYKELKRYDK